MNILADFIQYVIDSKTQSLSTASGSEARKLRTEIDLAYKHLSECEKASEAA